MDGIYSECGETRTIGLSGRSIGGPEPEQRRAARCEMGEDQGKTRYGAFIVTISEQFVHPALS